MKGSLTAIFGEPGVLAVVNTHLLANVAGDWSAGSGVYQVQSAQLEVLQQVVRSLNFPVIAAGDFNMPATTPEFGAFLAGTGLTDVFGGACPPTIRSLFLPHGATAHCIDFILGSATVEVKNHELLLDDDWPELADSGPVSDHVGLLATVTVAKSR
jgi:endonuclease/exonuclease/phosphatase family metal-dependent hydrolase